MKLTDKILAILACIIAFNFVIFESKAQKFKIIKNSLKAATKNSFKVVTNAKIIESAIETQKYPMPQKALPNMGVLSTTKYINSPNNNNNNNKGIIPNPKNLHNGKIAPNFINSFNGKNHKISIHKTTAINRMMKYIKRTENRFLNYAKISSQSIDTADMNVFPISPGQIKIAEYLENELCGICKGSDATIIRSNDQYVYVKIPSNIKNKDVPSLMFMAHLDVTPETPAQNIKPIVHYNYDGGDIKLPAGIVLSPNSPQGTHLKNCKGKTIITSDGSTLLGADDKAGVTVLVGAIEIIVKNKKIKHGDLYFVFSQNEDIGRAADRFEGKYVDGNPDIIIDVDGNMPDKFSVENFTASMLNYHFIGHDTHPGDGFVNKYGDALTAASYFIGQIDPKKHPSASKDKQGYIHCYSMTHPTDSMGKELAEDYLVKVRLRYFDKNEGDTLRQMLKNAEILTAKAYPFVRIEAGHETMQYENIAYTMYPGTAEIITKSADKYGLKMSPCRERGGTPSAMMAAKGLRGGPCIYSGQQAAHSVYEWVCVEDMVRMTYVTISITKNVADMKKINEN